MFLFKIPFGIWFIIVISILIIIKKKFTKTEKIVNKILYVVSLIFLSTLIYAAFIGLSYPCPCGCGSEEIDRGIKGIIVLFTKEGSFSLFGYFLFYIICVCVFTLIIHSFIFIICRKKVKKLTKK